MRGKLQGCLKSWTIKFNTFVLAAMPVIQYAHDTYKELEPYLGPETFKLIGVVVVVANILLRFKTTTCLSEK